MNTEKVVFAFFIVLALTLSFGFCLGEIADPDHHNVFELYAALVINLIATVLKFGDRTHMGAVMLATSLVADLQLICAAVVWALMDHVIEGVEGAHVVASIVSLAWGALLANFFSVVLLVVETATMRR